jgi:hypothetical protein
MRGCPYAAEHIDELRAVCLEQAGEEVRANGRRRSRC